MKMLSLLLLIIPFSLNAQSIQNATDLPSGGNHINNGIYLNRNSGFLRIINGTGLGGEFQPRISGLADSDISPGLVLVGTPSLLNSQSRGVLIRGGEQSLLPAGNVLQISNYTTSLMVVNHQGDIGIGNEDPKSKLHLENGDIFLEDITSGVIMKSPNGQCWRYQPNNSGNLVGTLITCPN